MQTSEKFNSTKLNCKLSQRLKLVRNHTEPKLVRNFTAKNSKTQASENPKLHQKLIFSVSFTFNH